MTTLKTTQGNASTFRLRAFAKPGVPMDLTGATFETRIPSQAGTYESLPNGQHTALDQTVPDTKGVFTLDFTAVQSTAWKWTPDSEPALEVVTIITQAGKPIAFHGVCLLRVDRPIPRG